MTGDAARVQAILRDPEEAGISVKEKALLRFVKKAATVSSTMKAEDAAAARAAGWSDEALYDAVTVVSLFRFYNTWCDSAGVHAMTEEAHGLSGKRIAGEGYAWK